MGPDVENKYVPRTTVKPAAFADCLGQVRTLSEIDGLKARGDVRFRTYDRPLWPSCPEDQLLAARVEVLHEAAENVTLWLKEMGPDDRYYVREQLRRMADDLKKKAA